jgi:uncharacterized protein DUF6869
MEDVELTGIVDAWIAAQSADSSSVESEQNQWAIEHVILSAVDADGDFLWDFVRTAYPRDLPDKVVAVLAAGPLEDLLAKRGTEFIDRVEELARKDPKFNHLLGGVWRNTMPDEVWQRVQSIRNHVW